MSKKVIDEIQIIPVKPNEGLLAFASFVLYGDLYCSSVAVFSRPAGGYRLVYPTKCVGDRQVEMFYPINKEIGEEISEAVISKYKEMTLF